MVSLKKEMAEFRRKIEPEMAEFLNKKIAEAEKINEEAVRNLSEIKRLVENGGKRIRPFLIYLGFLLCGGKMPDENIYKLGVGYELFHTFALIHDDIIDGQLKRRGQPTLEARYQDYFKKEKNGGHLAMSSALLGGDLAATLANLTVNDISSENSREIQETFLKMQFEVIAGQMDDVFHVGISDLDFLTEKEVVNMLNYKSGKYSVEKPLILGALLAGCSEKKMETISEIGTKLGLVFQIRDDLLDLFGDEKEMGKSASDLAEGKRTLLMIRLYQSSSAEEKAEIKNILGKDDLDDSDIDLIRNLLIRKELVGEMEKYCKALVDDCIFKINNEFVDNSGKNLLIEFTDFLVERKN